MSEDTALPAPDTDELTAAKSQISTLESRLRASLERHRNDIATIGKRLMQEAESRDWCAEYDEIVDEVNSDLYVELPTREVEYEVTVELSLKVKARTEDDAGDAASDFGQKIYNELDGKYGNDCHVEVDRHDYRDVERA